MTLSLGIDVGGTFTDLFLYDSSSSRSWSVKTPSTPANQVVGVIAGVRQVCTKAGIEPKDIDIILHGTTVATNALLEGKGARVGLLTSYGWRNILHLRDSWTPGPLFGFFSYQVPPAIIPHERVRELRERVGADGRVIVALDEQDVASRVTELVNEGIDSLTICLLHAYLYPKHEQVVAGIAAETLHRLGAGHIRISLSSEVSPEFREYERTVTTVLNSYLTPVMERYLSSLEVALRDIGAVTPVKVVRSDGGLMSVAAARSYPVQTALSGPSGGVNGAAFIASRAGYQEIITFDMGGTSSDISVCRGGGATVTRETRVAAFPVRAPALAVETIGAGGGSIADVSEVTSSLRVGPRSAGAEPGPACYRRGGTLATVSDANVVAGHLPVNLLGGDMVLDVDAAERALAPIAEELSVDVATAAQAVIDIVNGNMLGALRVVTVQKGLDPRDFSLVCFGGAGGLHANALAAALGCFPVIVPPEPGVLSALGFVVADTRHEFSAARLGFVGAEDILQLHAELRALGDSAASWLAEEGVPAANRDVRYVLDMRYERQGHEIPVQFGAELFELTADAIEQRFDEEHKLLYGFNLATRVETVTLRAQAIGVSAKLSSEPPERGDAADVSTAVVGSQPSWIDGPVSIPVYDRRLLRPGMQVKGKAVISQYDATVLVLPGHTAHIDEWHNVIIEPDGS